MMGHEDRGPDHMSHDTLKKTGAQLIAHIYKGLGVPEHVIKV